MSITGWAGAGTDNLKCMLCNCVFNGEKETLNYYPEWHTSSSSRKPSYHSIKSAGGWVYLHQKNTETIIWALHTLILWKADIIFLLPNSFWNRHVIHSITPSWHHDISSAPTTFMTQWIIPYVHEAKCSDVGRVCVSDQTHQLFASQLESKQFV